MLVRWWSLFLGIAATLLVVFFAVSAADIALLTNPDRVMNAAHPLAAVAGVLLLIADVFLPVPSSLIMVAHGALFGIAAGTFLSVIGSTASALTAFAVGRAGNALIRRFVTPAEHERAGAMLDKWGLAAIVITRPIPILAETVAILAGASPVTWPRMLLASFAGSLVPALAYAWAGAQAQGLGMQTVIFFGVIAVTGVMMVVGKRLAPARRQA